MNILVIEDEVKISSYLIKGLGESGFNAQCVHSGKDGLTLLEKEHFDLVILDVMLPDIDGWTVLKILRQFSQIPVLFLTAKDQIVDRVKGLELGADDYLVKPFSYIELLARIKTLLRRKNMLSETLSIADLRLDTRSFCVYRQQQKILLSKKEFELLHYLLSHQNEVVTRAQISSQIWNINFDTDTNIVDVAIRRLRIKIDDSYNIKLLHTIRGIGYKIAVIV